MPAMTNKKLMIVLATIAATIIMAWAWSYRIQLASGTAAPGSIYDSALNLSGLLAIAFMSITVMLSTRPAWLETPLNGLDQMYRLHKWTGILAVIFAALHWLTEMSDDLLESLFGSQAEQDYPAFIDMMRDAAEAIGEWVIYLLIALVLLTLWKRFPYKFWRYLHRAMPVLYLLLVFHAIWLAPLVWWQQPVGILMALLLSGASLASIVSVSGKVGQSRQSHGTIIKVSTPTTGITEVVCQLDKKWQGHRAGQFAFVTFDPFEGAHPFTIANADHGNRQLTFQVKALGDYTRQLHQKLKAGQSLSVEGPYGRFNFKHRNANAEQIWVAGGIGITPFLARLDALQHQPGPVPAAHIHYSTHNRATDPFVSRLQETCAGLGEIQLHIHDSQQGEKLTAAQLLAGHTNKGAMEVWFCGPAAWAKTLEKELREKLTGRLYFRREAFDLR
jgi:predicted ferric reductase